MTFKHVKFQDSAVMRSLEKVAREKGLIKEDLVKTASVKKASLVPTTNLLSNLITLSEGLREAGFDKYADELEKNSLAYKRAQTLYETSKETGDDLVESAHPKGSHKLENVDSDESVFETIIDQHLKHIEMIDKKPTGKLASSFDILRAVKTVLGEDSQVPLSGASIERMYKFTRALSEMFNSMQFFRWENDTVVAYNRMNDLINKYGASKSINMGGVDKIIALANDMKASLEKETFLGMQSTAAKNAKFHVNSLINFCQDTLKEEVQNAMGAAPKVNEEAKQFASQIDSYLGTLRNWAVAVNNDPENSPEDKKQAGDWIASRTTELNELKSKFKPEEAGGFMVALNKSRFARESAAFKKTWIG